MLKTSNIKADFPAFKLYEERFGASLSFFDSAASSQTPACVVEAMNEYYYSFRSNVHRSPYRLGTTATSIFENARATVARFIGAEKWEIVFTPGATAGINMLVHMLESHLKIDETHELVTTVAEHHSQLLPLQELSKRTGSTLHVCPLHGTDLDYEHIEKMLTQNTKIVCLSLGSNVLGTLFDVKRIINKAHSVGAICIIDATTVVGHVPFTVGELDCDFLFFSGHKMLGPTGIGVLYGKESLLHELHPTIVGGGTIMEVSTHETTYRDIPAKFEAGTPNIAGAIGLARAITYLESFTLEAISEHSRQLSAEIMLALKTIPRLTIISEPDLSKNLGIVSFYVSGLNQHHLASYLDEHHVAIRAGHHCAMPLATHVEVPDICRVSSYLYNDREDVKKLVSGIKAGLSALQ